MRRSQSSESFERARALRREMTHSERTLWSLLRDQGAGVRFRRQHPLGPYVLDFYCPTLRLCVEVDGESHGDRPERYLRRDAYLAQRGILTIRLLVDDLMRDPVAMTEWLIQQIELRQTGEVAPNGGPEA